jgi:hypothetical protein
MTELLDKARNYINKAHGGSVVVNNEVIDSDALSFVNDKSVYIHFLGRNKVKPIDITFNEIKDVKFDFVGAMTIISLCLVTGSNVLIHCLP